MPPSSGTDGPARVPSRVSSRVTIASSSRTDRNLAVKGRFLYLQRRMTLEELRAQVSAGMIDTVLLALTDMQGRLQGKRLTAGHFLDEVAEHGAEGCNYLLGVDVEM